MPFRALKRPLQFLGLFETSLCRLTHIPAYKVRGGGGGEDQGALGEGKEGSALGLEMAALGSGIPVLGLFWDVLIMLHLQVSGDKNEEQVLNAIEAYTEHRPEITSRAINLLFDIARIERCNQLLRALKVSPDPGGPRAPVRSHHSLLYTPPLPQDTGRAASQTPAPPRNA